MKIKKPSHLGKKLLLFGVCAAVLALWNVLQWPCLPRAVTGLPCITCGMTRAWLAAFRLDLASAFSYHPVFWSVPVLAVFALYDGRVFKSKMWNCAAPALLVAALVLCYAIRLVAYLKGDIVF